MYGEALQIAEERRKAKAKGERERYIHLNAEFQIIAGRESEIAQSCLILCQSHAPGSSVHWILQARVLEWGAISFSRGSSRPKDRTQVSCLAERLSTIRATRGARKAQLQAGAFLSGVWATAMERACSLPPRTGVRDAASAFQGSRPTPFLLLSKEVTSPKCQ